MTTNDAGRWLAAAHRRLTAIASQSPGIEAQALLASILHTSRVYLLAHPELELTLQQSAAADHLLDQLLAGQPLPYLTGRQEFFGLEFEVTPDTLIPRPETELLVETALDWLKSHPHARSTADIGTGSGCIAVTLAALVPDLTITAVDISPSALAVAARNAASHHLAERIKFKQGDLLSSTSGPFHLICANLPYIPSSTLSGLEVTRFEPRLALDGGPDGLDLIRRLLQDAPSRLLTPGLLLLEIESSQGQSACDAAVQALPQASVSLFRDLSGLPRLVKIEILAPG